MSLMVELARTSKYCDELAQAQIIELCGQLAMNPETAPGIQLLTLQCLAGEGVHAPFTY